MTDIRPLARKVWTQFFARNGAGCCPFDLDASHRRGIPVVRPRADSSGGHSDVPSEGHRPASALRQVVK